MKVFLSKIIHWILVLGIVINIDGTFAQAESTIQDIINLCNEQSTLHCEWLENYRQQNMVNDVLRQLSEDSTTNLGQYRPPHNHISPRFASYESTSKDVPQYPFSAGWKGQLNKIMNNNWNNGKVGKIRSRKPFNYDSKRTPPNMFSSWGGKRVPLTPDDSAAKREPSFSSWGGKRTQKFFNWGGKRSIPENEFNDRLEDNYEHNIMKREVSSKDENDTTNSRKKRASDKKLCLTDELNLQELFKEFIEWSRRQPEQKKGSFYKKMFTVSTLHSPDNLSRRAGSFFQWGGKRSLKQN
ncbi:uncharacterized protein LOC135838613 isoform X2 [Planococcus citri]